MSELTMLADLSKRINELSHLKRNEEKESKKKINFKELLERIDNLAAPV